MKMKRRFVFLLAFALLLNAGGLASSDIWQEGWISGELLSINEAGNMLYRVSLQPDAVDLDGTPLKADNYICALLLQDPDATIKPISDSAFEMVIASGGDLPNGIEPVAPNALGLQVLSDEEGAYLLGDVERALAVLAEMNKEKEMELADAPIPLSDGSDIEIGDEEHTPAEGEEVRAILRLSDPGLVITVGDRFNIEVKDLMAPAYINLPDGIVSTDGANKLFISPTAPETPRKIALNAEKAGQFELRLVDEMTGAEIADPLKINVEWATELPTVKIHLQSTREDGLCEIGDEVMLVAEFDGDHSGLALQWQCSPEGGGGVWNDIPGATDIRYTFTITEENRSDLWRIIYKQTD